VLTIDQPRPLRAARERLWRPQLHVEDRTVVASRELLAVRELRAERRLAAQRAFDKQASAIAKEESTSARNSRAVTRRQAVGAASD